MKKILTKNLFSIIVLLVVFIAIYQILKLNVLPNKYLFPILIGEGILFLLGFLFYNFKNKLLMILGILIYLIGIIGNSFGIYYLGKVNRYIDDNFSLETYSIRTKYYLLTSSINPVESKDSFDSNTIISYYKYSRSIDKALKDLGDYQYVDTDNASSIMFKMRNENDYFLIGSANYDYLFDSTNQLEKTDFKILYEFEVIDKVPVNNETPDVYNVYINGLDFTGVMRDYNLIASVNTKTRKVVLTSIPRDYYMDVPAYNMKDTLMCMGSLDSFISKEALENLFGIHIDYTINLNTNSLVKVVDTIGGVEFCSDFDFVSDHALVLDTYDDSTAPKLHVIKGCKNYSGIEILTIARERMALPGRDRYRQKNCRQILINILKKMASTVTLSNYNEILKSFDGVYTTDMNDKTIKNLAKVVLEDTNFEIIEQSVDGNDEIGIGHLGTAESWIMVPDMNTVDAATQKINEILNEK